MTKNISVPIYWEAPYQREILSQISKVRNSELQFSHLFFYPGGGGQLNDNGTLIYSDKEYVINEVYKDEKGEIWHRIETSHDVKLEEGKEVLLKLDWGRRYAFMKAHSAQHLTSHLLIKMYNSGTNKGHFDEGKFEIEIDKDLSYEDIINAIHDANQIIHKGGEIKSIIVNQETYQKEYKSRIRGKDSQEKQVRMIQLGQGEGFDLVCCGGLHVKNLNEINGIILESEKNRVIKLIVDNQGFSYANEQRQIMLELEEITEKKGKKLVEMVQNKVTENELQLQGIVSLLKILFSDIQILSEKINDYSISFLDLQQIDRPTILSAARELSKDSFLIILGKNEIMYFLSTHENLSADEVVQKMIEKTGNKGGGNKTFSQISVKNLEKPVEIVKEIIKNF